MRPLAAALALLATSTALAQEPVATFSIVAFDPATGDLGVAVASRVLAVGNIVPWARTGVGAVATQAWADPTFGPRGLELLASGRSARQAVDALLEGDPRREERQLAIVDARGRVAAFTGAACKAWAGMKVGAGWSAQGNILESEDVVSAMGKAFEGEPGGLTLRLLAALEAGEAAGGDRRGRQSAAILVVRARGGFDGKDDRYVGIGLSRHVLAELGPLLARGRIAEARTRLDEAVRLAPEDGIVLLHVARLEAIDGKADAALAALERSLAARPDLRGYLEDDRAFDGLREDERFRRLTR